MPTAEAIEMQFWMWVRMGPRNHVLIGVQIPHGKRHFEWERAAIIKYRDALL